MKLVIGLGNPGPRYAQTRHNVGFMVLDQFLRLCPGPKQQEKFAGLLYRVFIDEQPLSLLKPTTFMNLSGVAVEQALSFYKLPLESLLVITDDMALPTGTVRLRRSGSDGGHNGLASICQYLASEDFPRLRIGIGPSDLPDSADYVLAEFSDVSSTGNVTGAWTAEAIGVDMLSNDGQDPLYLIVEDSSGKSVTVTHPDPGAVQSSSWQDWLIPLSQLDSLRLNRIKTVVIGAGYPDGSQAGSEGILYIDDVRVGSPLPTGE